jgi:hypothetical protein
LNIHIHTILTFTIAIHIDRVHYADEEALLHCRLSDSLEHSRGALPRLRRSPSRSSSVTLRKRLHINDLITEPGTVEIDWANLYSYTSSNFTMPSSLKFTPMGTSLLWGRTEYSIAFDSISSAVDLGSRTTQVTIWDRLLGKFDVRESETDMVFGVLAQVDTYPHGWLSQFIEPLRVARSRGVATPLTTRP